MGFLSGSRGKILLGATVFFLITIIGSFRGRITESEASHSTVGSYAGSADQAPPAQAIPSSAPASPPVAGNEKEPTSDPSSSLNKGSSDSTSQPQSSRPSKPDECAGLPDLSDVLLVMKTGATEAYDKLPIHFVSTLKCVDDVIIFSDMNMNVDGYKVIDVLAELPERVREGNPDFDLYRTLKEYEVEHRDPRDLKAGTNGWNLDKYKFVPMLKKTWDYRKDVKWYVFIEADSFIQWENLMTYLDTLNPEDNHYLGSPTGIRLDIEFAHGGSGYVISGGAMAKAVGAHSGELIDKYGADAQHVCCGDRMTGKILRDEGINLTRAWPMFNGEKPPTLPFGDNQWCQPVMTMHHMTAQEISNAWTVGVQRRRRGENVTYLPTISFV